MIGDGRVLEPRGRVIVQTCHACGGRRSVVVMRIGVIRSSAGSGGGLRVCCQAVMLMSRHPSALLCACRDKWQLDGARLGPPC